MTWPMSSLCRTRSRLRSPGPLDRLLPMPNSGGRCASRPAILAPGNPINGDCGISRESDRRMFRRHVSSSTVPSNSTRRSPPPIRDWRWLFIREGMVHASRPLLEALRLSGDEAQKALELDPTDADAHGFRADAAGHLGDYAAGFDHVERALSINPNCAMRITSRVGYRSSPAGPLKDGKRSCGIRLDPRRASYAVRAQPHCDELLHRA